MDLAIRAKARDRKPAPLLGVDTIIRRLTYFRNRFPKRGSRRKKLTKVLKYFRDRRHMMAYADFVSKGLPIRMG